MGHFEQILATLVEKALTDLAIPEDQIESARGGIAQDIMAQFTEEMRDDLLRRAPAILKRERRDTQGFEKRNLERWRSAFDLVELIWIVAAELGSNFNNELRDQAQQDNDYLFEALTHLHARALLVSNEALCLMKGGFPDGALSRWRTLHEHSVIAMFLKMHGSEAAHRYLASFDFQALKSARQMREYAERARIELPSDAEIEYLEECCKRWTS